MPISRRMFLQTTTATAATAGAARVPLFKEAEPLVLRAGEPLFLLERSAVEDTWALRRRVNPAVKSSRNPVIRRDRDWEGSGPYTYGTVLYDPRDKLFKCWYTVYHDREYRASLPGSYLTCYAMSRDGYQWEKPDLGLVEWRGSRHNNYIRLGEKYNGPVAVVAVPRESGIRARYVCSFLDRPGVCIAVSDDGKVWRDARVIDTRHSDTHNCILWDAVRRKWMVYLRAPVHASWTNRRIALMESADLETWTRPEEIFQPDEQDFPEFYGMPVFQRGNLFFGLVQIYDRPGGSIENQLVFSPDGRRWERVPPRETFLARGAPGSFDAGMVFASSAPAIAHGELRFYYGAIRTDHNQITPDDAETSAVGLATVPLDRLFGLEHSSAKDPGVVITRPLRWLAGDGGVELNATVQGQARAALVDLDGKPLAGFDLGDCAAMRGDDLRHAVRWKGGAPAAGAVLRLKVEVERGTLWAVYFK
jgi:hypothetical protein